MTVLILTGKFGMGHFSAAKAIQEKISLECPETQAIVIDFVEYLMPKFSKYSYMLFNFLVNHFANTYNLFASMVEKRKTAPFKRKVLYKIDQLILEYQPTLIISTLPICTQYISYYKKMRYSDIPLYTYITDISINNEWVNELNDFYFVGSNKTKKQLISKGVLESKIIVSGIPVLKKFNCKGIKKEKHILIMGGGLGIIPHAKSLLDNLDKETDVKVTVILGNNKKLYKKLYKRYKNIEVIGFTNDVNKYLKKASLIISKAGGITTFEAIAAETPMIVLKPFLLQERGNARFILENNLGIVINKNDNFLSVIKNLINNPKEIEDMKKSMREMKNNFHKVTYRKDGVLCI